jgi:putative endonuclease
VEKVVSLGPLGEKHACDFLKKNGCKILERNFRAGHGEIDIIARLGKIVLFVEVKTRASNDFAQPWESVGFRKRKYLKTAAKLYVQQQPPQRNQEYRFDVLSITMKDTSSAEIEWIQNAF